MTCSERMKDLVGGFRDKVTEYRHIKCNLAEMLETQKQLTDAIAALEANQLPEGYIAVKVDRVRQEIREALREAVYMPRNSYCNIDSYVDKWADGIISDCQSQHIVTLTADAKEVTPNG